MITKVSLTSHSHIFKFLYHSGVDRAYIGLNDRSQEGKYVWNNGQEACYTNWMSGEPNDHNGAEDCVEALKINGKYVWNDIPCNWHRYYVCEKN